MQLSDRIGRRMKLQDLHVLMTVVQAGSMGKAAERLNTVQPAISRAIAELEHTLGVRLLDRHRQGVEPTEYGRALLNCGAAVFDELRQGVKNIEFLTDPTAGQVRIGCNPLLATTFVSVVVDRLSRRYPRIVSHPVVSQVETLYRELTDRNLDLLITRFDPDADERFGSEFLFDDSPFFVAAGAQSPWARRRRIRRSPNSCERDRRCCRRRAAVGRSRLPRTVRLRGSGLDNPRTTVLADFAQVRMSLLATGRFLTVFPASVLRFSTRRPEFKVLPVELPIARVSVGIVTLKNRTLSPVARLFIEHARGVAKPLAKRKG